MYAAKKKNLIFELRISVHIRHKSTESTYQHASNSHQAAPTYISQNSMPDLSWISSTNQRSFEVHMLDWGPFCWDFAEFLFWKSSTSGIQKTQ